PRRGRPAAAGRGGGDRALSGLPAARPRAVSVARVPFFDRTRGDAAIEGELTAAFHRVVRSGQYILGREVEALEAACAGYLGVRHAIGVSSGSDALALSLL